MVSYSADKLNIKYVFYSDISETWHHAAGKKDCLRLFYVVRGKLRLSSRLKTYTVNSGEAFVLGKNNRLSTGKSDKDGVCFYEIGFDSPDALFRSGEILTAENPFAVGYLFSLIYEDEKTETATQALSLLFSYMRPCVTADKRERETAEIAKRYIKENVRRSLQAEEIAEHAGCDRSYLSRVFSSAEGVTLKSYIVTQRIAYAKALLEFSSFSVNKIAELMDFDDANLFTKFFAYHTGVTPSDYRRRQNGISPAKQKEKKKDSERHGQSDNVQTDS